MIDGVAEAALLALWRVGAADRASAVPAAYVQQHENTLFRLAAEGYVEFSLPKKRSRSRVWWLTESGWGEARVAAAEQGEIVRPSAWPAKMRSTRERRK